MATNSSEAADTKNTSDAASTTKTSDAASTTKTSDAASTTKTSDATGTTKTSDATDTTETNKLATINIAMNNMSTNNTTTAQNSASFHFSQALTRLMGDYMLDEDLEQFSKVDLHFLSGHVCQQDIEQRKFVREKILPSVFNAVPDELKAILKQSGFTLNMLLTKARFNEGYLSDTLRKFVLFRLWGGVSPLTAAAYSGDEFFVLRILAHLVQDDNLRVQAMQQLKEVQSRITDQTLLLDAANAIVDMVCGQDDSIKSEAQLRLEKIFEESKEFQGLIADQSIVEEAIAAGFTPSNLATSTSTNASTCTSSHNQIVDQKYLVERKVNAEKYAEDTEFLTPFLRYLKATLNYLIQHQILNSNQLHYLLPKFKENISNTLDHLFAIAGESHKRFFHNLKQECFDSDKPISANSTDNFNREPNRSPCRYFNGNTLNLDNIGIGTLSGLYKLIRVSELSTWAPIREVISYTAVAKNLGFLLPYYKHRTTGLGKIIDQLKTRETAETLVAPYVNKG